jgi:hypothetical protein
MWLHRHLVPGKPRCWHSDGGYYSPAGGPSVVVVPDASTAPVARLDGAGLLAELNARSGAGLALVRALPGGQVGAAIVRWPDGRHGVLTHWGDTSPAVRARFERAGELLALARANGVPAPRYDLVTVLQDRIAIVQERLPGAPPERVDLPLVQAMVDIARRGGGLLTGRADVPGAELHLLRSGPGFCVHESLAQYDDRTRALLALVRRIGAEQATRMAGDDVVHLDFHPGNVLVDRTGAVTGVVDWDGVERGDHRFALVTLRFDLALPPRDRADASARQAAARWLDARLDDVLDPGTLRTYWAHMSLRLVYWSIRHHGPDDVDRWLTAAVSRLG